MLLRRFIPIYLTLFEGDEDPFAGSNPVATANFLFRAAETFDVWTFTVTGTITAGDTYSIKRNGKTITFTAVGTTIASITAGLLAALQETTGVAAEAEFTEYTPANPTSATITLTALTGGIPATFTAAYSAASTGAIAAVHTTTATGVENDNDANNWDTGSVPGNGDTANYNLDLGSVSYGLNQTGIALAAMNITSSQSTSNTFGLPKVNASGGYTQDRTRALLIGATAIRIDCNATMINLNIEGTTTLEARRTGTGLNNNPALLIQGGNGSSVFEIDNGSMGLAYYDGETATAATVRVGQNGSLVIGAGATAATITSVGTLDLSGAFTTLNHGGNNVAIVRGTPGATTITGTGGRIDARFGGTLTNLSLRNCVLDKSNDLTPLTITNTTLYPGAKIIDPQQTITYTNKPTLGSDVKELSAA